jgi:hypothetical protein
MDDEWFPGHVPRESMPYFPCKTALYAKKVPYEKADLES